MWEFKALEFDAKRNPVFVPLSAERAARAEAYRNALTAAKISAVANPKFSNYFVKESIGFRDTLPPTLPAGNIEYGLCQALHGEEFAVAALRSRLGRPLSRRVDKTPGGPLPDDCLPEDGIILGIIAGVPGNIASPCGNCRDIMRDDLGINFEIVSGAAEGGVAIVAKMSDFLYRDYFCFTGDYSFKLDMDRWQKVVGEIVGEGMKLENAAYVPADTGLIGQRKYMALIETDTARYFGAHDVMCEYHPIYALRDAVRVARRSGDPFVKRVTVVAPFYGEGDSLPPDVMYKDRQHLLELTLQGELVAGEERDPSVYLFAHDGRLFDEKGEVKPLGAWLTSVKEWLPLAFSPRNFGEEYLQYLTKYFKSKTRVEYLVPRY